jgi:hypothetical protein
MHKVIMSELKVSAQARHGGGRDKKPHWNQRPRTGTSRQPVPTSAADKLSPEAVLTSKCFAPLRTTDMSTGSTDEEIILLEREAPGRSPTTDNMSSEIHEMEPVP